jgi:hypothetical protein
MARDHIVYLPSDKGPTKGQLGRLIKDYLGGIMTSLRWGGQRWTAVLVGPKSWMYRRSFDPSCKYQRLEAAAHESEGWYQQERWIEVWLGDDCIDVITRQQDELTNDIASRLAWRIALLYKGTLEKG